jgi:hypothetical protein
VLRIAQTQDANDPHNPHRNPPAGRRIPARRDHLDARSQEPGQAGAATPWESRTLTLAGTSTEPTRDVVVHHVIRSAHRARVESRSPSRAVSCSAGRPSPRRPTPSNGQMSDPRSRRTAWRSSASPAIPPDRLLPCDDFNRSESVPHEIERVDRERVAPGRPSSPPWRRMELGPWNQRMPLRSVAASGSALRGSEPRRRI